MTDRPGLQVVEEPIPVGKLCQGVRVQALFHRLKPLALQVLAFPPEQKDPVDDGEEEKDHFRTTPRRTSEFIVNWVLRYEAEVEQGEDDSARQEEHPRGEVETRGPVPASQHDEGVGEQGRSPSRGGTGS